MAHKSLLKDGFSVFTSQMVVLIVHLILGIILARVLGPEGNGISSALLVYPTLIISILSLGIRQASVYYIGTKKYSEDYLIGTIVSLFVIASSIGTVVSTLIYLYIKNPNFNEILILFALLTIPVDLTTNYATGILIGKKQINKFNRTVYLNPLINLILVLFFIYFDKLYVESAVFATLIAKSTIAIYALWMVNKINPLRIHFVFNIFKELTLLGSVYAVSLFIMSLNYQVDIIILERLSNAAEIGQYTIGVSFAQLLWQIPTALGLVIFSHSSNAEDGKEFTKDILKTARVIFPVVLAGALVLYYMSSYIIPLLYGQAYVPSVNMLKILLPGIIIMCFFKIFNMDLAGKGKPDVAIKAFAPAVLINVVLNIILIPDYGGCGAAFASTVSYSFGSLYFTLKYIKINHLNLSEIYMYKKDDFNFISDIILKLKQKANY